MCVATGKLALDNAVALPYLCAKIRHVTNKYYNDVRNVTNKYIITTPDDGNYSSNVILELVDR